jgi:outer membrane lipase/esterase
MKDIRWKLAALAAAAIVAACGGGETADGPSNKVGINAMVTFGDSLSDIGSYNVGSIAGLGQATGGAGRFTVNATTGGQIWTERIAALLPVPTTCSAQTGMYPNIPGLDRCACDGKGGLLQLCPRRLAGQPAHWHPVLFAGKAPRSNQYNLGFTTKPVKDQMSAHLTASGGSYTGKELVTVLAGANDVFVELGSVAAGAQTPQAAVTNVATAGAELGAYIKSMVVAKGAKQVLVVNMPYVAGTPFGQHLDAQTRGLVDAMTTAFNAQLAAQLAGVSGVILGDFYSEFKAMVSDPAQYALTNVTTPVCGPNALSNPADAPGSSLVCNASNVIKGDISHYAFADDVHPTPYGHQLLSQFASRLMAQAGWL